MKKLLLFLTILCFSLTPLVAEEVEIEHPSPNKESITLTVPETYEDLREAYIEMAKLYIGERYDLETCLDDQDKLLKNYDKIKKEVVTPLMDQLKKNEEAIEDIAKQKIKPEVIQFGVFFQTGMQFNDGELSPSFYGMPYVQLFELVNVGVFVGYPLQLGLGIGVEF
jgi:hypothetical protein